MSHLLDIPDDDAQLPGWIEQMLVSPEFGEIASQLQFLNQSASSQGSSAIVAPTKSLDDATLREIATDGLASRDLETCRQLLRHPQSLVDLNDLIFEHGSDYWMGKIPQPGEEGQASQAEWLSQVRDQLFAGVAEPSVARSANAGSAVASSGPTRRMWLAIAASIAAVGLGVAFSPLFDAPPQTAWGWMQEDALPANVSADKYLAATSDSVLQWFDRSNDTADELSANLQHLAAGCQKLIDAPHEPLSEVDRAWMLERCLAWQPAIHSLADSAAALSPDDQRAITEIRNDADDLVSRIANALKKRAQQVRVATI